MSLPARRRLTLPGGRSRLALLVAPLLLLLAFAGLGRAQGGPGYVATPPTFGALYRDGQTDRYLLGGTWLYRADRGDVGVGEGWWRDVSSTDGWSTVSVPNAYNAGDFSTASMDGYVGWYRRDFTLPRNAFPRYVPAGNRHWIIRFESVNYTATVWLNGHLVGSHAGADLPFEFDLHPRPGVNRLIVRVDNRRTANDLPKHPYAGWWNFGGILREVYLRSVAGADLERVLVTPVLPCPSCSAQIEEQALVRNLTGHPITVRLRGAYGSAPLHFDSFTVGAHQTWTARAAVTIARPRLWAPGHPALYRATVTLLDAHGRRLGGYITYSGIRSIKVTHGVLELNGRVLHLRGVAFHEQNIASGAALDPAQMERLMGWVRELGATIIRVHYPYNPEILEMADRYGILVWSEIPAWGTQATYLSRPGWLATAHTTLTQNILTNENHPSVLLWSIGNEFPTPAPKPEAKYIAGAVAIAHRLDPTRPVGMAIMDWPGIPCQHAYGPLQVLGFNEYFGWFDEGGGATDDRDALSPFLNSLRACYPKKALLVTEFGFDANRNGSALQRGTYQFQSNAAAFHLHVFASKPWLSGAIYWTLQDFAAWPGWDGDEPRGDPPFVQKGLVDLYGNLKPAFSVVSKIYHSTVQIGPPGRPG